MNPHSYDLGMQHSCHNKYAVRTAHSRANSLRENRGFITFNNKFISSKFTLHIAIFLSRAKSCDWTAPSIARSYFDKPMTRPYCSRDPRVRSAYRREVQSSAIHHRWGLLQLSVLKHQLHIENAFWKVSFSRLLLQSSVLFGIDDIDAFVSVKNLATNEKKHFPCLCLPHWETGSFA